MCIELVEVTTRGPRATVVIFNNKQNTTMTLWEQDCENSRVCSNEIQSPSNNPPSPYHEPSRTSGPTVSTFNP